MKSLRMLGALSACLVALGLVAGCGTSTHSVAPGTTVDQGTADDFAVQALASLDVVSGDMQVAIGGTPSAPAMSARVAPARAMWDTTYTTSNGLTYSASRTFYDDTDTPLPGWSPSAVRLHWTSTASGTAAGPVDTATVGHASVVDARGIQAGQDTLRFDGACLDTLLNRFRSLDGTRTRHFYWTSSLDIAAVRILKSTLQTSGRPIGGTVTFVVSADRLRSNVRTDVEVHFDATVVVVFNDTGTADITVNSTYHYLWNLQTGAVVRA